MLTAAELLEVWETGQDRDPARRALVVLAAATGAPVADLLAVSIPRRDTLLFDVRRLTFGDELRAIVSCPACGESLEFSTTVTAFEPAESPPAESVTIETGTLRASIRPPTTVDLLAIREARSIEVARDELLGRCVESLERAGTPVPLAPPVRTSEAMDFRQEPQSERPNLLPEECGDIEGGLPRGTAGSTRQV